MNQEKTTYIDKYSETLRQKSNCVDLRKAQSQDLLTYQFTLSWHLFSTGYAELFFTFSCNKCVSISSIKLYNQY